MTEDDARPEALRRFELMVEEVARNASAVAQNTAAAKKSASDASTSASEAATHATDAADSARAASTSAGQAATSAQEAFPAQERHQQKPLRHQKVLPLQSPQKARRLPVPVRRKRQKRMLQRHKICSHFCIHRDHESVRSCHLSPGCGGLKRGSEIIRNERIIKCQ